MHCVPVEPWGGVAQLIKCPFHKTSDVTHDTPSVKQKQRGTVPIQVFLPILCSGENDAGAMPRPCGSFHTSLNLIAHARQASSLFLHHLQDALQPACRNEAPTTNDCACCEACSACFLGNGRPWHSADSSDGDNPLHGCDDVTTRSRRCASHKVESYESTHSRGGVRDRPLDPRARPFTAWLHQQVTCAPRHL